METEPTAAGYLEAPPPCFECSICLDFAAEPVVTLCGHLYCWPCIHRWLLLHRLCPVCKSPISPSSSLVPLYGRGGDHHPGAKAPPRPRALPLPPSRQVEGGFRPADPPPAVHPIFAWYVVDREEPEGEAADVRSLRRISSFLFCCVLLCLLLF